MKLLKDKVALITGGSRGIGRSICKSFAENGCSIAFTYNSSKESAETLIDELKEYNVRTFCISPGSTKTKMARKSIDQNYDTFLDPIEVANFIVHTISFDNEMVSDEIRLNRMVIE